MNNLSDVRNCPIILNPNDVCIRTGKKTKKKRNKDIATDHNYKYTNVKHEGAFDIVKDWNGICESFYVAVDDIIGDDRIGCDVDRIYLDNIFKGPSKIEKNRKEYKEKNWYEELDEHFFIDANISERYVIFTFRKIFTNIPSQ